MCWVIYDCRKSNLGPAMFCVPWPNNVCFPDIFKKQVAFEKIQQRYSWRWFIYE